MFARVNLVTGDPARTDDGIRMAREQVRPLIETLPGYRGMALAVDRDLGKSILTTYWDSEETLRASEAVAAGKRSETTDMLAGTVTVQECEVVGLHTVRRPPHGSWMRVTSVENDPADVDLAIEAWRASTLPAIEAMPGVCQALLYVDRRSGRGASTTVWESRDALAASRSAAASVRAEGTAKAHATVRAVEEYELVFASLKKD